jgi:uncharacterized membrane protein YgdD (TMEM256/DUF423 family)
MMRYWLVIGSFLGAISVILGAFGAHGLAKKLDSRALDTFHTAVDYQFIHVFIILFIALVAAVKTDMVRSLNQVAWMFLMGIILFSGSLYAWLWLEQTWLVMLTPLGGTILVSAWVYLGIIFLKEFK